MKLLHVLFALTFGTMTSIAVATPLTGQGNHLPLPTTNLSWPPGVPEARVQTTVSEFEGSWGSSAHPDWQGTYKAVGRIPSSTSLQNAVYDFTTLPLGYLPAGTFFIFSDLDTGSNQSESIRLLGNENSGFPIGFEWLDEPVAVTGTGRFNTSFIHPMDMPAWNFHFTVFDWYTFRGSSVTVGNPNVTFALVTNEPVYTMRLVKNWTNHSFSMMAPRLIPEPSTALLTLLGVVGAIFRSERNGRSAT